MWDELNQYIEIPECTCGAAQAIVKSREDEKAHPLDPLPTLGKIYAMVTQEERHRSMARGADRAEITFLQRRQRNLGDKQIKEGDVDVAATVMLEEEQLQDAFIMQMQLLKQIRKKKDSLGKLRNGVYYYKPLQGEKVNTK
ncbi:hypothetical protein AAG906_031205 [Vitis piasezkii]